MSHFIRSLAACHALVALLFTMPALASPSSEPSPAPLQAKATLLPVGNSHVHGTVTFTQTPKGVELIIDVKGLKPGDHGFHIHEFGDCNSPDAMSAGGHFNPGDKLHGAPHSMEHHEGDLGNIVADKKGKVHDEMLAKYLEFKGTNSFIGRAVIVHATKDDLTSQPAGNAGARVACGVIGLSKYE